MNPTLNPTVNPAVNPAPQPVPGAPLAERRVDHAGVPPFSATGLVIMQWSAAAAGYLTDLDALLLRCPQAELLTAARAELGALTPHSPTGALTDREVAVLRLLRGRLTLPEIAQELWLSPNTVKTHVRSIYRKLRVSSREEVRAAART